MLPAERREKILKYVQESGKVVVEELAKCLSVSTMTIRRDLQILDGQGLVIRTHGGAIVNNASLIDEVSYQEKVVTHIDTKRRIAGKASELVQEGYTIILDAGTTNMELAKLLISKKDVRVITNDILIAAYLYPYSNIEVFCCGGMVQNKTGAIVGGAAKEFFTGIFADIVFLGASAFNLKHGVTTPNYEKAQLKQQMLSAANQKVLMCDSSKYGKESFARVCQLQDLDLIITDFNFEQESLNSLSAKSVTIKAV
ncbi:MAG TPA: DeoR/GlpR family DNA-binding transcription regulator [Marinilabiliaceae bacterium]|nr:DeoR/GlpR family DNA-binding transcription regulator [Marinilabiliaceae bacterium]